MSLPTAYGNVVPFDRSDMRTAGLEVKQWAADVMRYGFDNMSYAKYLTSPHQYTCQQIEKSIFYKEPHHIPNLVNVLLNICYIFADTYHLYHI